MSFTDSMMRCSQERCVIGAEILRGSWSTASHGGPVLVANLNKYLQVDDIVAQENAKSLQQSGLTSQSFVKHHHSIDA